MQTQPPLTPPPPVEAAAKCWEKWVMSGVENDVRHGVKLSAKHLMLNKVISFVNNYVLNMLRIECLQIEL